MSLLAKKWDDLPIASKKLLGVALFVLLSAILFEFWFLRSSGLDPRKGSFTLGERVENLPNYGTLPNFLLQDQNRHPFARSNLQGKPTLVGFILTRCVGPCPLITASMVKLRSQLPAGVHFVSLTIDPKHDTPGTLLEYAKKMHIPLSHWSLLTGDEREVTQLVQSGFSLPLLRKRAASSRNIVHATKLVLLDDQVRIRGYYDPLNLQDLSKLQKDVKTIL